MNFTGWVQAHRVSVLFLIAVLVVGGVAAIPNCRWLSSRM